MTTRYRLTVAYLGTGWFGWQRQPNAPTIQAALEDAVCKVVGVTEATVTGAGRTDSGVHAAAQVAHVDLVHTIPADGLARGLNGALAEHIRVTDVAVVPKSFHARFSARGKHYTYRCRWSRSPVGPPWREQRAARVRPPVEPAAVEDCATLLVGAHDWASFTVTNPETSTTIRTVYEARLHFTERGLRFDVIGEGFLRYQVRRMVGALLEIGWGRHDKQWLLSLLDNPQPGASVLTAPARGLTLEHVYYRKPGAARTMSTASELLDNS